jgi:hypothetical protein
MTQSATELNEEAAYFEQNHLLERCKLEPSLAGTYSCNRNIEFCLMFEIRVRGIRYMREIAIFYRNTGFFGLCPSSWRGGYAYSVGSVRKSQPQSLAQGHNP